MASEFLRDRLPADAEDAGMFLLWHRDPEKRETVTLVNRDHRALFLWPYIPSLTEARDKAMELVKDGSY